MCIFEQEKVDHIRPLSEIESYKKSGQKMHCKMIFRLPVVFLFLLNDEEKWLLGVDWIPISYLLFVIVAFGDLQCLPFYSDTFAINIGFLSSKAARMNC
jgi:hypothetical protein